MGLLNYGAQTVLPVLLVFAVTDDDDTNRLGILRSLGNTRETAAIY
jgi:hypothetical protein